MALKAEFRSTPLRSVIRVTRSARCLRCKRSGGKFPPAEKAPHLCVECWRSVQRVGGQFERADEVSA